MIRLVNQQLLTQKNILVHLYFLVDNTGSMGETCAGIGKVISQIIAMFGLVNKDDIRITLCVIGDYDTATPNHKEGGWAYLAPKSSLDELKSFLNSYCQAFGGGGCPEAYMTGFNKLLLQFKENGLDEMTDHVNIVFNLCDAVPHGTNGTFDTEGKLEQAYLRSNSMIGNWSELCRELMSKATVCTFLTTQDTCTTKIWEQVGTVQYIKPNQNDIANLLMGTMNQLFGLPMTASTSSPTTFKFPQMFQTDTSMAIALSDPEAVLGVFEFLLDPKKPETVMSLTTNCTIGKFYRHVCGKLLNDPRYADRCQSILDLVSSCVGLLSPDMQATFKEWNNASHDQTQMVRKLCQDALDRGATRFLVLNPLFKTASIVELLDFARSGQFGKLLDCVSNMELAQRDTYALPDDDTVAPDYIPLDGCKKGTVMSMIANLIERGNLFPRQATFMVAILCLNNTYLKEIALEYLTEHIGKWINWELDEKKTQKFPLFWSLAFIRLLKLAPNNVLTLEERDFRDHYLQVAKIVTNHQTTIDIVTARQFKELYPFATWKRKCASCGQKRCFTIFPGTSLSCGICLSVQSARETLSLDSPYLCPGTVIEDSEDKSCWAQCSCGSNYTVTCPSQLNVNPKCHFCRHGETVPNIQCCTCLGFYLNPDGSAKDAMAYALSVEPEGPRRDLLTKVTQEQKFVCPRCMTSTDKSSQTSTFNVTVCDLIAENRQLTRKLPIGPYHTLMDPKRKIWERVLECKPVEKEDAVNDEQSNPLTWKRFHIHKSDEVAYRAITLLTDHSGFVTCSLCVSDVQVQNMIPACGNCNTRICKKCVTSWYSQVKIGQIVSQAQCHCPFCKAVPIFDRMRTLEMGAFELRLIRNLRETKQNKGQTCDWDPQTIYGFCRCCLHLKPVMERECARGDLPVVHNFVCETCRTQRQMDADARAVVLLENGSGSTPSHQQVKECPKCKTMVERTGGCNHITCHCGSHWCWTCCNNTSSDGETFDENTIYDHMADCGGIFPLDMLDI
jgi:hypothetical protein